jgi:hypothetical protein
MTSFLLSYLAEERDTGVGRGLGVGIGRGVAEGGVDGVGLAVAVGVGVVVGDGRPPFAVHRIVPLSPTAIPRNASVATETSLRLAEVPLA